MQEIILKAQSLSKRFGNQTVFKDFSFELIGPGLYAIVGRNGSGKSTLLKILSGLLSPSAGHVEVFINSKKITEEYFKELSIATPYQELPEELSLSELVKFYQSFRILNLPNKTHLNKNFLLPDTRSKPIKTFSSGMKQRVRLGLAFYTKASILFLDEPTSNLDQEGIDWYLSNVKSLSDQKLVVVSSNHQQEEYPEARGILEIH